MNTFFLKGRSLTLQTSVTQDGKNKMGISNEFVGAFEVIAFHTSLDYENFYVKGSKTFFELFDVEPSDISETLFSEKTVNSAFLFVFPRLGTISPWASKAQNILDNTFQGVIDRVERCQIFLFNSNEQNKNFSSQDILNLKEFLVQNKAFDPLIEDLVSNRLPIDIFIERTYRETCVIDSNGEAIMKHSENNGLALTETEVNYIVDYYTGKGRKISDLELMMFAQVNSEHCRHKIFNSNFVVNGKLKKTPFELIKETFRNNPGGVEKAYNDNAAVITGFQQKLFIASKSKNWNYTSLDESLDLTFKAETHNHPTGISPFPGAATGAGGEIRDESATGRGGLPLGGFVGFAISDLKFTDDLTRFGRATGLGIMLSGPLGSSEFNNEFGRPTVAGYFRVFEENHHGQMWGFRKPIMLAGGVGLISSNNVEKWKVDHGDLLIVLGGPGFKIGIGGGAASSVSSGFNNYELDFKSVQRGNPEMQRRAQEVINFCAMSGEKENIIKSIHDVGAGGLSNAIPELAHESGLGVRVDLDSIPVSDNSMNPLEIWTNESQERYVLAIEEKNLAEFNEFCLREKAPYAVVGQFIEKPELIIESRKYLSTNIFPIDVSLDFLLNVENSLVRNCSKRSYSFFEEEYSSTNLEQSIVEVLKHPTVSSKSFLITIGDRTVGGCTSRDQMAGPWQTPVADCAVMLTSFCGKQGVALALGERPPIAVFDVNASVRMCLGELITNILAAPVHNISNIKLSANWMGAVDDEFSNYDFYSAVAAINKICIECDISIPVGKDSLSMSATKIEDNTSKKVRSPISLNLSGVSKLYTTVGTWTPCLDRDVQDSCLIFLDLAEGEKRMRGSTFQSVFSISSGNCPDVDSVEIIKAFSEACHKIRLYEKMHSTKLVHAYHDRSDGGLLTTLCEMAFAGRVGITVNLDLLTIDSVAKDWGDFKIRTDQVSERRDSLTIATLFNEELGVVLQATKLNRSALFDIFRSVGLGKIIFEVGSLNKTDEVVFYRDAKCIFRKKREYLQRIWSQNSFEIAKIRDNEKCAQEELDSFADVTSPEHIIEERFKKRFTGFVERFKKLDAVRERTAENRKIIKKVPKVAILREQGVNGHREMAAAFHQVGFNCVDVHMQDLISKTFDLSRFDGLAISGGFSYGDVLGAGRGWAQVVKTNKFLREAFLSFFCNPEKFVFGVCNGCQFLSELAPILPGKKEDWPNFSGNISGRFEARQSLVEILPSNSVYLKDMENLILPISVAHGYGRVEGFMNENESVKAVLRFVDLQGNPTESYPYNPNGSTSGLTGFSSADGRILMLMPHPERNFRGDLFSWKPKSWGFAGDFAPWALIFENVYKWIKSQ